MSITKAFFSYRNQNPPTMYIKARAYDYIARISVIGKLLFVASIIPSIYFLGIVPGLLSAYVINDICSGILVIKYSYKLGLELENERRSLA